MEKHARKQHCDEITMAECCDEALLWQIIGPWRTFRCFLTNKTHQNIVADNINPSRGQSDLDLCTPLALFMFCYLSCLPGGNQSSGLCRCQRVLPWSADLFVQTVFALTIWAVFHFHGCTDKPPFIPVKQTIATKIFLQVSFIFGEGKEKLSPQSSSDNKLCIPGVGVLLRFSLCTLAVWQGTGSPIWSHSCQSL